MEPDQVVHEVGLGSRRLRDLGLTIAGTMLESVIATFSQETMSRGFTKLRPHFYLSTEWGVPFDTISIAIPFYLARVDLTDFHAEHAGFVEGADRADVLRYLRHEMGHVVNYAYRLYEQQEWNEQFGDINLPYVEEYRAKPFDQKYVVHLPGWYAQKHPDEDWAETFAVWMTPGLDWRARYAGWPALKKLEYCDRITADLRNREPLNTAIDADEDVAGLDTTLDEHYRSCAVDKADAPVNLDDALHAIFGPTGNDNGTDRKPAAALVRRSQRTIAADVFRWTGWFPERARHLMEQLAELAEVHGLTYAEGRESAATVALAVFVTSVAMSRMTEKTSAV